MRPHAHCFLPPARHHSRRQLPLPVVIPARLTPPAADNSRRPPQQLNNSTSLRRRNVALQEEKRRQSARCIVRTGTGEAESKRASKVLCKATTQLAAGGATKAPVVCGWRCRALPIGPATEERPVASLPSVVLDRHAIVRRPWGEPLGSGSLQIMIGMVGL